jgi:diketogulonate reductase-like aldo/keto reductase
MVLIYGFYHVPHNQVADRIGMARAAGIHTFDTAQLYGNERQCAQFALEGEAITTKIFAASTPAQIAKLVKRSIHRFEKGGSPIRTLLLHRPMSNECWAELVKCGASIPILGVSNYDFNGLQLLLDYCRDHQLRPPQVHQLELHPFVDVQAMLDLCRTHQIQVQAHTVLAQGKFFDFVPLRAKAKAINLSPAQVMLMWAQAKGVDICIGTRSPTHLQELVQASTLSLDPTSVAEIDGWHIRAPHRFYGRLNRVPFNLYGITHPEILLDQLGTQLLQDRDAPVPSDLCDEMPLSGHPYRTVGLALGQRMFPEAAPDHALALYRNLIKDLRNKRIQQRRDAKRAKKEGRTCTIPRYAGSYAENILHPTPMPVTVTDPEQFIPLFEYLVYSQVPPQADTTFVKGSVFPDGRLDLCKQVVGPTSIQELCRVVAESAIVRHFLLGNNVALQDNEIAGATALAQLMANNTKAIETWYLAGNCIGPLGIQIMAKALESNCHAKALWLKRNPIGPLGAGHLNAMLRLNRTLVLLDLHNCALGDEGLACLLENPHEIRSLKHLYLDANAIESIDPVAQWCRVGTPVTLYLSINRLGDTGAFKLAQGLTRNPHLRRLCLASTKLRNQGFEALVEALLTCPRFQSFNAGTYKSTVDMGEHPGNFFDDEVLPSIHRFLTTSPTLQYFNCVGSKLSPEGKASIPRLPHIALDLGLKGTPDTIIPRSLKHPRRVVHIDSIYRGKM